MSKKNYRPQNTHVNSVAPGKEPLRTDELRIDLAVGTLCAAISILALYLLNSFIYNSYHPDTKAIMDQVLPMTVYPDSWFHPEPVERLQFTASLFIMPFLLVGSFFLVNKLRQWFVNNSGAATAVNVTGILAFLVFIVQLMGEKLVHVTPEENTTYFFANNLAGLPGVSFIILLFYLLCAWLMTIYSRLSNNGLREKLIRVGCYLIAAIVLIDIFMYDVLNIALANEDVFGEINAVFYSITQVYAGKALLVDFNAQYGLYAWFLSPVFKVIGLSTYNFGLVMAFLNSISFLFLFLGIRKLVKNDVLSLLTFLCLVFWQFWQTRVPGDTVPPDSIPRMYYQYWPIRLLFPTLVFYLVTLYCDVKNRKNKILLPLLAICAAAAVLWNLDTGIVVFGSAAFVLVIAAFHELSLKEALKKSLLNAAWMLGALLVVVLLFFITTKMRSGAWPDFGKAIEYQGIYYGSGYYMLAMNALHFWNIPVLIYLVAGIYCIRYWRKDAEHVPVIAFLFVLGGGLFTYFQGRSYDTNINIVMYPAIIIVGIFCNKLFSVMKEHRQLVHERTAILPVLFVFLADGAFSMIWHTPAINSYGIANVKAGDELKEKFVKSRLAVVTTNLKPKDTVLIISRNYESFIYAAGGYINPMNAVGSTELFFKKDFDSILSYIKRCKYPIVYDNLYLLHPWYIKDSLLLLFATHTVIDKVSPDGSLLLLKPRKVPAEMKLKRDDKTVFYNNMRAFWKYWTKVTKGALNSNFDIEFIVTLDTVKLNKENILFTNASEKIPFCGVLMQQSGDDLTQYKFMYGDGKEWTAPIYCKLVCTRDNHVLISGRGNIISIYNNGVLQGQATGNGPLANSDGAFYIGEDFPGVVEEIKIENY